MLAYRHLFHAGNFADAFKHAILAQLVIALARKDKPFFYLDTHAGIGLYDLNHPWAQKNKEFADGVGRLWERRDIPDSIAPYMEAVRADNPGGRLRFYPGSPRIARRLLRPQDRMVLSELNKSDCETLARLFAGDRQVQVYLEDGFHALKAFLPPRERRGLILIDASFDRSKEFDRLTRGFVEAHRRFATGVYAIWYPLMEPPAVRIFERGVAETGIRKILKLELAIHPERWRGGLRGAAMLIVNPPFGFDRIAPPMVEWLWKVLSPAGEGGRSVRWLVEE